MAPGSPGYRAVACTLCHTVVPLARNQLPGVARVEAAAGCSPSGTTEVCEVSLGLLGLPFTGCAPLALQMVRDAMVAQPRGNVRGGANSEGRRFPGTAIDH